AQGEHLAPAPAPAPKPAPASKPAPVRAGMCKNACGRPVQPGLTRGMKAFDTCCKKCAQGKGGHDANCGGSSGSLLRRDTGLEDPRVWLQEILGSEEALAKYAGKVMAGVGAAGSMTAEQAKEAGRWIDRPVGLASGIDRDIVVKNRPDLNFDGLKPAPDRVWLGNMTFEIASEEWTVDKFLNYGAEGQTYLVTRSGTGERFAAKFCSKEDSMEVKLVQDLPRQLVKHENFIKYELIVLNVHGIFAPAHHIIFMEHIPNGELFDVLASQEPSVAGKPLNEGTSRRFLKDIISGMAECYRYGVTHRDLKPENLLINENGKIVIIDMGHAKRVVEPPGAPPNPLALSRTTTSNPYGTPAFNAPEVSAGKSYDCEWSDVWSVGVIAFYLHGKLPAFQAGGGVADWKDVSGPANDKLWRKIVSSNYYPPFPVELQGFINALWRLDPAERPRFSQLERAMNGDEEVVSEFPGLQWLTFPVNDVESFIDELSRYLLQPIGVPLQVDDQTPADWVSKYGTGGAMDTAAFTKLVHVLLEDRLQTWFPQKLCAKTHNFVQKNPGKLEAVYDIGKLLGEGSFGKVYNVQHRIAGESRVCKKIAKLKGRDGMKVEEILQEIESMATLDHPNVIKVYEYFEDRDSVSQIMEPCYGGELQDRINDVFQKGQPRYDETFVCDVMKQTLRALAFMHSHKFMHKDLKPQNIMLVSKDSSSIKVIDFGLAELFTPDQKHSDAFGGTLLYMAPEVFKLKLVFKSDIWSAGVILYNLLTGDYPFMAAWPLPKGKTMEWWQSELARSVQEDHFRDNKLLHGAWSAESGDLLKHMLEKDVNKRPDAAGCLEHGWFKKHEATPPALSVGVTQCLEAYAGQPELKKAIFLLIAHMCTAPALGELRAIFTHFDVVNRGALSLSHFREVLFKSGMSALQ
ncbi:unnamed protein product, partial [Effrenium voratum]